jgi:CRP-like cAMP-binding protein
MSTTSIGGGIFRHSEEFETFPAGTKIFEAGQKGDVMYAVRDGEVELVLDGKVIETVLAGGVFGEMALVDDHIRTATAIARTDCNLVAVNERKFQQLINSAPFFAIEVMRAMAHRLRRKNESPS